MIRSRLVAIVCLVTAGVSPAHADTGEMRRAGVAEHLWSAMLFTSSESLFLIARWGEGVLAAADVEQPVDASPNAWVLVCGDSCEQVETGNLTAIGTASDGELTMSVGGKSLDVACADTGPRHWFTRTVWIAERAGADWTVHGDELWASDPVTPTWGTSQAPCTGSFDGRSIHAGLALTGMGVGGYSSIRWSG